MQPPCRFAARGFCGTMNRWAPRHTCLGSDCVVSSKKNTMRVNGKSIIVTGAGGGIGEGIAKRLASEGAQVVVNDVNASAGQRVVADIQAAGGRASFFQADVTQSDQVHALVAVAVQRHGVLDVMVNNAGWTHRNRPALEVSEEEFDSCYAVNVKRSEE